MLERLAVISGVPILLDTRDPDEFVEAVVRIAPTFGAINLVERGIGGESRGVRKYAGQRAMQGGGHLSLPFVPNSAFE